MENKGLGDTIGIITKYTGIKKVVDTVSAIAEKDCGCGKRQEQLNNPDLLVNKIFYNKK
jgi:hypothetical protein